MIILGKNLLWEKELVLYNSYFMLTKQQKKKNSWKQHYEVEGKNKWEKQAVWKWSRYR